MADSRIAYGLAKKHGIDTTGMSPQEVWEALKEKGISLGTDREADQERLAQKYSDNGADKRQPPVAKGFNRSGTKSHLAHAKEMGLNEKEYVKAAEQFFNGVNGELYYDNRRKCFVKIDEKQQLLCACEKNGSVKTFHTVKKKSITKIIKQDKLEKIWKK